MMCAPTLLFRKGSNMCRRDSFIPGFVLFLFLTACGSVDVKGLDDGGSSTIDDDSADDDTEQDADVEIIVDDLGVPHIFGKDDRSVFFGQGYWEATDRLFQIDVNRRKSTGRMSEVFGEDGMDDDKAAIAFRWVPVAQAALDVMADSRPDDFALFTAYVDGLNARVAEVLSGDAPLPWGFGPDENNYAPEVFSVPDVMAMGIRLTFGFSATIEFDVLNSLLSEWMGDYDEFPVIEPGGKEFVMDDGERRAARPHPSGSKAVRRQAIDDAEILATTRALRNLRGIIGTGEGSNNWVVNGANTDTGMPILVNDSHAGYEIPSRMAVLHLNSADAGGEFDVIGFSFPGIPSVQVGATPTMAWGATTAFSDTTDLWRVKINEADEANLGGEWKPIVREGNTIRVRREDGGFDEVAFESAYVDGYGVLIPDGVLPLPNLLLVGGDALLMNWPGYAPSDEIYQYFDLNRARNLDDFESAIQKQVTGMQNWVAVDPDGIRYKAHGRVPERGPLATRGRPDRIMDAANVDTLWNRGDLGEERLPYRDGTQPFIVTANNDPWGHTFDNDGANDEFYYGTWFSPGLRAALLTRKLDAMISAGPVSLDDMTALNMDATSAVRERLVPLLVDALATVGSYEDVAEFEGDEELADAVAALEDWNGAVTRDSAVAALSRLWIAFLEARTLYDDLGILLEELDDAQPVTLVKTVILVFEDGREALTEGRDRWLLLRALRDALIDYDRRASLLGRDPTWADIHDSIHDSVDGVRVERIDKDGDDTSPNVSQTRCWEGGYIMDVCESTAGSVYRFAATFDESGRRRFFFNVPFGTGSSTDDWVEGRFPEAPLSRNAVESAVVARYSIQIP